jgi:broad specificity phosphatase PhoE
MKLVVVRHLPTAWNAEDRLQGQRDIPITPPDAAALAALEKVKATVLAEGPYDRVYCSRMGRTRQTAELFGFPDAVVEPLLNELNFGEYEGRLRAEMLKAVGDAWHDAPHTLVMGESMLALGERVEQFIERNAQYGRVLVFGHGGWARALSSLRAHGGIERMNQIHVANGEALIFQIE